ncbi:hypothetical protein Krac_5534 [Ktedonobacter racemifer DSM 44963]|uniref:Uncharacterized protein n=1 Tax=Ktedonobacter racemifer DSM 44963 TaxID=485913 RepID=D6TW95_KTERA|nr:hypothetical protein Krac_5534 [Ktedonobacter racemifer DSM 44963]
MTFTGQMRPLGKWVKFHYQRKVGAIEIVQIMPILPATLPLVTIAFIPLLFASGPFRQQAAATRGVNALRAFLREMIVGDDKGGPAHNIAFSRDWSFIANPPKREDPQSLPSFQSRCSLPSSHLSITLDELDAKNLPHPIVLLQGEKASWLGQATMLLLLVSPARERGPFRHVSLQIPPCAARALPGVQALPLRFLFGSRIRGRCTSTSLC